MLSVVYSLGEGQQLPQPRASGTGRPRHGGARVLWLLGLPDPPSLRQPLRGGGSPAPLGIIHFPCFLGADLSSRPSSTMVLGWVSVHTERGPSTQPASRECPSLRRRAWAVKRGVSGSKVPVISLLLSYLRMSLTPIK